MNLDNLLLTAINSAINGARAIMKVYESDFSVEHKKDNSPLTMADKNCNIIINTSLKETGLPILSEEGVSIPFSERKSWGHYWLVDPLDGTKEFVRRNGEFTVNIALIYNKNPILGVVYVPVKKELYFALEDRGSFKVLRDTKVDDLEQLIFNSDRLPINYNRKNYVMVGSRSHMSKETEEFFKQKKKQYGDIQILSVGSSLKLCMVAEGKADAYPRYAPTMEWDTAAGHAIVKYAGFKVKRYNSSEDVIYNKQDLLNPWFLVS